MWISLDRSTPWPRSRCRGKCGRTVSSVGGECYDCEHKRIDEQELVHFKEMLRKAGVKFDDPQKVPDTMVMPGS